VYEQYAIVAIPTPSLEKVTEAKRFENLTYRLLHCMKYAKKAEEEMKGTDAIRDSAKHSYQMYSCKLADAGCEGSKNTGCKSECQAAKAYLLEGLNFLNCRVQDLIDEY
jgi:hypothetical protein